MLTALMILLVVFSNAAGDVFLTKGMKQVGDVSAIGWVQLGGTIKRIVCNANFMLGVACLAVSFFSFLAVLSWANLSFVVPATAIVYVVTVLGAKIFLGENVDRLRWGGTLLICFGVALVCLPGDMSLNLFAFLRPARFFFGLLTVASVCYFLASVIAAERFFSKSGEKEPATSPSSKEGPAGFHRPISVLVPLCGADFRGYQNYASLCRQNYPEFEILFGVADPMDSSLSVVEKLRADFPEVSIELVVSSDEIGPNPKVNSLNNMISHARHETILMLDSDIRVGPDFIGTIFVELRGIGEGLVTCLYRAGEAPGLPSKLEAVGISGDFAPGVLVAQMGADLSFAFGACIGLTKKTLETIGGFEAIAPYLADDYMLGNLVRKAGLPVRLSRCVVETVLSRLTLGGFFKHQLRWARGIRACAPWGHTGSLITNGTALSFLYFASCGFSRSGLLVFATVVALRLGMAWMVGVRRLGDDVLRRNLFLVVLRDFLSLFIWSAALFGRRVEWRDKVFRLEKDGRIIPWGTSV
ncbi:MAG: bacteriohopanetetrol glucosamine biosynthesis glycosyltransferase HpnI [Syntrophobacteraceae bacterium]|nr:bacteriohopanetetrol glucosamine biosynthesis glycosyltransferase HpnI [Syntrophobacteraceae bacterium]